jgi:glycosyltransferase involved in cell wall biosynthesis
MLQTSLGTPGRVFGLDTAPWLQASPRRADRRLPVNTRCSSCLLQSHFRVTQTVTTEGSQLFNASVSSPAVVVPLVPFKARANGGARPARVLIVESNQDGTVGGSHQALFDLATRVDRASFEPIVLFCQDNVFVGQLRARGVKVVLFDEVTRKERKANKSHRPVAKLIQFGAAVVRRRRELRRLRIDLLHLNNSPRIGSDDWLPAARLLGIPCVVTAMGDAGRPHRRLHQWLYRRFDLYLAISRYMADVLRTQGVDSKRIELVYLGVDFEKLRARRVRSSQAVRAELGVGPDQLLVLMVGNIRRWKGQHAVIAALRLLPENIRTRLRVCFAGATASIDTAYEAELRDEIAAGGLGDCVSILGPRSDVADLYGAADIAVHASTSPEPFGLVVPEAMALNCAMIAASSGGPAEVITPGTGFLCDPSEPKEYAHALAQLVQDDALRREIAAAGSARAAQFSIERTVEGTERVYRRALKRSSPALQTKH